MNFFPFESRNGKQKKRLKRIQKTIFTWGENNKLPEHYPLVCRLYNDNFRKKAE